jgi:hypothetical protein
MGFESFMALGCMKESKIPFVKFIKKFPILIQLLLSFILSTCIQDRQLVGKMGFQMMQ